MFEKSDTFLAKNERLILALLLLAGVALRLAFAGLYGSFRDVPGAEAYNTAISFARSGAIADAYFLGQGPTAHLSPIMPVIAGTIYWIFGPGSPTAWIVLLGWSLLQVSAACYMQYRLSQALLAPRLVSVLGLAFLCLVPLFARSEIEEFRYWDSALTVTLASANLLMIIRSEKAGEISVTALFTASLLAAVLMMLNSIAGLAIYCCWGLLAFRQGLVSTFRMGLVAAAVLALTVAPWALRNAAQLGKPIPFRSNFGLELAIGNHPAALDTINPGMTFLGRIKEIHPSSSQSAQAEVRRVGEVAYSNRLGAEAKSWMLAHPIASARLLVRHWMQFVAPPIWLFNPGEVWKLRRLASLVVPTVNVAGMLALIVAVARRRKRYEYLLTYLTVVSLPYMLVQPVARYTYLIYVMLAFPAIYLVLGIIDAGSPKSLDGETVRNVR